MKLDRLKRPRAGGFAARSARFRLTLPAALVLCAVTAAGAAPASSATPAFVKPTQELAALLSTHEAFAKPTRDSAPLAVVPEQRPLTAERTVLPVLGRYTGSQGLRWLRVRLPGRPNGSAGWIHQRGTVTSTTRWHIVVDTSGRLVTVYRNGHAVRVVKAVVGKPSTPTPRGDFFVEESILLRAGDPGAPFALALSARSNVLQEFAGGPGQIALHGLMNVGGVPGSAVSHGCVRLADDFMRWLVVRMRIGPGVPVTIT